jgi:tRNA threonylcarbamoyladenosine biosynthesis protein TsaB
MHEVYTAAHAHDGGQWREVAPPSVVAPAELRRVRAIGDADWFGAGNGFAAYPALEAQLGIRRVAADARPTAQSIGELAVPRLAAGEGVAANEALPLYVRHRVALTSAEQDAGARL